MFDPLQQWQIGQLAAYGFSDRFIASYVLDKAPSRVTRKDCMRIAGFRLRKTGRRLVDYRNGVTEEARERVKSLRLTRRQKIA